MQQPRIRYIKPSFWSDEKLAPCSPLTRLVYLGLISMADDAGRMLDNLKIIDAYIFPESSETARGALDELSAMGRVARGEASGTGQRIMQIVRWEEHQRIDKPNLRMCLPPLASSAACVVEASGRLPGGVVEASGLEREREGERDNGKGIGTGSSRHALTAVRDLLQPDPDA